MPETTDVNFLNESSPAVQSHLNIEQQVIQRMATNSASCKAWCITLVSAILVVAADKGKPAMAYLALPATVLFLALDSYYLALERMLRASYKAFLRKLYSRKLSAEDLFVVAPKGQIFRASIGASISFSIMPFYVTLLFMVIVIGKFVV